MELKLGKKPATYDSRDVKWSDLRVKLQEAGVTLPTIPASFGHANDFSGDSWLMLGNGPPTSHPADQLPSNWTAAQSGAGCCVPVEAVHTTMELCKNAGKPIPNFTATSTIAEYAAHGSPGYDPVSGANDNGTDMRQFLLYRQKTGFLDADGIRHKIGPFWSLEPGNLQHLLESLYFAECAPIGFQVPQSAMDQWNAALDAGRTPVFSRVAGTSYHDILGGHDVPLMGHPWVGEWAGVSWAMRFVMTGGFLVDNVDEMWSFISQEAINAKTGQTFEHYNEAQLLQYLTAVAGSPQQ